MAALWSSTITTAIGYAGDLLSDLTPVLIPLAGLGFFALLVAVVRSITGRG